LTDDFDDTFADPLEDDPFDEHTRELAGPAASDDSEALVRRAIAMVDSARAMPLSTSVLVSRDELLALLNAAIERLPDEMRQARWLLKEREEFVESGRREADHLLEDVRAQAERMVQRTEIVRQANQVAQRVVEEAREEARRLRHEAEDFCDQKLASFEIVLERTLKTVIAGREKLQATPPPYPEGAGWRSSARGADKKDEEPAGSEGFFDQDEN
jgi:vacuolar-type H+-ATPase subunit H